MMDEGTGRKGMNVSEYDGSPASEAAGRNGPDIRKRAKLRCMHLLEKRDYTEAQLREKLRQQKNPYEEEVIDEAIDYVKSYHYVDDHLYAVRYLEQKQEQRSRRRIEQDLMRKGIDRELIREAMQEVEPVSEIPQILNLLRKRQYDPEHADRKEKQKIIVYLAGKGFAFEEIRKAMGEIESDFF